LVWPEEKKKGGGGRRTWALSEEPEERGAVEAVAVNWALIYAPGWQMWRLSMHVTHTPCVPRQTLDWPWKQCCWPGLKP